VLAFPASMQGGGVTAEDDSGLWGPDESGAITLRVRESDPAPGGGSFFGFLGFSSWQIDDVGNLVVVATLRDVAARDVGIFWSDVSGAVRVLARKGDLLAVAPGDERLVASVGPLGDLNDARQVLFHASFADGSDGFFLATVPEPDVALSPVAAGCALATLRRLSSRRRARATGAPGAA
jgi:hypothetical protein